MDSVTYGDGIFVIVAAVSNVAAISSDGIHWTQTMLPSSQGWTSITYGNGIFVAVNNSDLEYNGVVGSYIPADHLLDKFFMTNY